MLRASVLVLTSHGVVSVNLFPFRSPCVCHWRQFAARVAGALFCAVLFLAAHPDGARAAQAAAEKSPPVDKPAPSPGPVPLAELSAQAEAATVNLRAIAAAAASNEVLAAIERELPPLTRELDARLRESSRILAQRPSLELLRNLERSWQTMRATLAT